MLITIASAALLLVGSFSRRAGWRQYLDAAASTGAIGILVAAIGRSATLAADGRSTDLSLDAWLGGAFVVLALAGVAQARLEDRTRLRAILSQLLMIVAMAATLLIVVSVLRDDAAGPLRAAALIAVFGALHVLGIVGDRPPVTRLVGWLAIAFAATVGVAASASGAIDKFEWATAAIAAALLTAGAVRMRRLPTATSWQWLAPGLLVLLLPTLVATFGSEPELWRLVTLGLACLVVIVVGALLRLQAALMIGAAVVLVHGVRTFAPQLIAVYQSTQWWVWAVVGGGIILFLGLTFEKRVRDLRHVGSRIGALR